MTKMTTASLFLFTVSALMFRCGDTTLSDGTDDTGRSNKMDTIYSEMGGPIPYEIRIENIVHKKTRDAIKNNIKVTIKSNEYADLVFGFMANAKYLSSDEGRITTVEKKAFPKNKDFLWLFLHFEPYGGYVERAKKRIGQATSFTYKVSIDDSLFFEKTISFKANYEYTTGHYAYNPWVLETEVLAVDNEEYVEEIYKKNGIASIKLAF